jgi:hypothetical protein
MNVNAAYMVKKLCQLIQVVVGIYWKTLIGSMSKLLFLQSTDKEKIAIRKTKVRRVIVLNFCILK